MTKTQRQDAVRGKISIDVAYNQNFRPKDLFNWDHFKVYTEKMKD